MVYGLGLTVRDRMGAWDGERGASDTDNKE